MIETDEVDAGAFEDAEATARARETADKRRKLIVAVAFGLPLFVLSMARDFGLIQPWLTPFWAANEELMGHGGAIVEHYPASADYLNWLFLVLATPVQFYSGWDFYVHAWKALKNKTANMDTLIALGSSAAYFYSVALIVRNPTLPTNPGSSRTDYHPYSQDLLHLQRRSRSSCQPRSYACRSHSLS